MSFVGRDCVTKISAAHFTLLFHYEEINDDILELSTKLVQSFL